MVMSKGEEIWYYVTARSGPPDEGFEHFVVGERLPAAFRRIIGLIEGISGDRGRKLPSQVLVVTGDNGNGKTLLNNMITNQSAI